MPLYSFEKLEIWKRAKQLSTDIYTLTKHFPEEEKFGITNQLRRSAISVSSNLAEGSTRKTSKDQARFSEIAYGSLMEALNLLILSDELGYITTEVLMNLRKNIDELANMINAYHKSQLRRINK